MDYSDEQNRTKHTRNRIQFSKYNINTKRLKISDLDNIFKLIKKLLHF